MFTSYIVEPLKAFIEYQKDLQLQIPTIICKSLLGITEELLRATVERLAKTGCPGCENEHGSQKNHTCLHEWVEKCERYYDHAFQLVNSISIFGIYVVRLQASGDNVYIPPSLSSFKADHAAQLREMTEREIYDLEETDDDELMDTTNNDIAVVVNSQSLE